MATDLEALDGLPEFDLDEYVEYLRSPQWFKDGFDNEEDYTAYW